MILSAIEIGVPSPKDLQRARVIPPSSHPPYRPAIHLFSCVRGGRGQLPVECTREQTCWWCALNRWYCGGLVFMRVVCVCAYWVRLDCERRAAAAGCLASYPGPCEVNILTYSTYCISTWFVYLLSSLKKKISLLIAWFYDKSSALGPKAWFPLVTDFQPLNT